MVDVVAKGEADDDVIRCDGRQVIRVRLSRIARREPLCNRAGIVTVVGLVEDCPAACFEQRAQATGVAPVPRFVTDTVGDRRSPDGDAATGFRVGFCGLRQRNAENRCRGNGKGCSY
jgi:hypothetical protein